MSVSGQNLIDSYAFMKGRFSFVERNLGVAERFGDFSNEAASGFRKIKIFLHFELDLETFLG